MNKALIRLLLADDHKLLRESWRNFLDRDPRFSVLAVCENGAAAIEYAGRLLPDIILVDINLSPYTGYAVTAAIAKNYPVIKIIGISLNSHPRYAKKMLELGAKGYLTKTSPLEEINQCILEVHNGGIYICEEISLRMKKPE